MTEKTVLSAEQYARFRAFQGDHPDDIAIELSDVMYRLDEATAQHVAFLAWSERTAWDARQEHALDESAVNAEHDLEARTMPRTSPAMPPDQEAEAREACRVANRARKTLRLRHEDLVVLVCGTFFLDLDTAYAIADAAYHGLVVTE